MAATPPQGVVRYRWQDPTTLAFRVEGRATMVQSLPLRKLAEYCLDHGGARDIRVELGDCAHMDSTFMGTLLTLQKSVQKHGKGALTLVGVSAPCSRILHQMGLDDMFPADAAAAAGGANEGWTVLPLETDDANAFKRNVRQAHEVLADVPGKCGEQFQGVVRCMNQAEQQAPPTPSPPPAAAVPAANNPTPPAAGGEPSSR